MTKAPETIAELAYAWGQYEASGTSRAPLHGERKAREFIDNEARRAFVAGRTISRDQVENAAATLLGTEWEWRGEQKPHRHDAAKHYSPDCPLCRPDYGDNAQRIARAAFKAAGLVIKSDDHTNPCEEK